MSSVNRNGKGVRPAWNYLDGGTGNWSVLEMTESLRNVCEQIRDSQILQCDVAHAIKDTLKEIKGLRRDLKAKRRKK